MATGRLPDPNTAPVTAKGDLYTYSTVPAKLAVGNNGETLVADSSATTGLRWQATQAAGRNAIINGGMDIWQRGTSFTTTTPQVYMADRWQGYSNTTGRTYSRQSSGLADIQYGFRMARNSGNTNTTYLGLFYSLETADSLRFAGQTVTFSFYAKAGANFSASSSQIQAYLTSGTGTDQNVLSGFTGSTNQIAQNATLTTTYQRFSYSVTLPTTITQLGLQFFFTPVGTAGANDWCEITGVQLEVGAVATAFTRTGATLAGEFQAAQRYYQRFSGSTVGVGFANSTTVAQFVLNHKTPLRNGTVTLGQSGMGVWDVTSFLSGGTWAIAANNNDSAGIGFTRVTYTHGSASLTQYRPYLLQNTDANSWLEVSAEL